jgi:uncharacterized membrane protein YphA (DoxX/SURF4 family)
MSGIYVEIDIHCSMEDLWMWTQTPELHQQWDLRFTDIEYLPRPDRTQPQRFLYKTRIGFGLNIAGEGESVGTRESDGSKTSALKFWSDDSKSLIKAGSGYWQYIPLPGGIRFLTWYDYTTRFGVAGRLLDAVAFRPMLGWATAWSFDRLRLKLEKNVDPATTMRQSLIYGISRIAVALVWIYHGLIPKLLFAHPDESALLLAGGISSDHLTTARTLLGIGEIAFGLVLLLFWNARFLFIATIALMIVALLAVAAQAPEYLVAAFNPLTLNIAVVALSAIGLLAARGLPSARRCRRRKPETA